MRLSFIAAEVIALLSCVWMLSAQTSLPRMTTVNPMTAQVGEVVTAAGENLDENNVAELFLTDNKCDVKVQITEQSATTIKSTVPDSVKPGRFGLVIRTPCTQANPMRDYVQPVKVTVE